MACCLVQTGPLAPTADQLKRAFKSLKTFTDADAVKLASECCGIVIKNLSPADAAVLQRALQAEGAATESVEADRLPRLPAAKFVRRLDFHPESLAVYDPLGRPLPVPWPQVALISGGLARHFNLTTTHVVEPSTLYQQDHWKKKAFVEHTVHNVETDGRLVLDIFLTGGLMRFQIEAEAFQFKYCFDRPELDLAQKLGALIQMLAEHAPHAILNRGAAGLRDGLPGLAAYASKAALFDESVWLLWQMSRPAPGHP
jgi:hypothetical protein